MAFLQMHSEGNVLYTHFAFSLIKYLLVWFLLPALPPEAEPAPSSQACLVSCSVTLYMSGLRVAPTCFEASPWCPLQAVCRGPCGPLRRGPCAAAAARATPPVLQGWLGHWHSHSGHGTQGPAS